MVDESHEGYTRLRKTHNTTVITLHTAVLGGYRLFLMNLVQECKVANEGRGVYPK